jgi:hypothetical protein
MHEISKAIYDRGNTDSVEKFDYFIVSVAGALFAYVGQSYVPHKFDSVFSALMPLALVYLILAFVFGCRRIYLANIGKKLNKECVKEHEDCKHITETLKKFQCSENFGVLTDNITGEVVTAEYLTSRRNKKLATKKELERVARLKIKWANSHEKFRDICLFLGFVLILAAKIFQPYLSVK